MFRGIPIYLFFSFFILSCSGNRSRISKKEIIPKEDLVPVLVDIHIADGILGVPSIMKRFPGKDSISNYQDVLRKFGYSLDDLNKTIQYYSGKPEKFEVIYESVQNHLSKMESEIRNQRDNDKNEVKKNNLWIGKSEWYLPKDGGKNQVEFSIPVLVRGVYTLQTRLRIFPDDQSVKPRISAYFWFDNGTKKGQRFYLPEKKLAKTGLFTTYTISGMADNPMITHIKGKILDHSPNKKLNWYKHAEIASITLFVKPLPDTLSSKSPK